MFRVLAFVGTFIAMMFMFALMSIIPIGILSSIVWLLFGKSAAITIFLIAEGIVAVVATVFALAAAVAADD